MKTLRADLVFSYWIYVWFILYIFKITIYSPKFALVLGVIDNFIMLILMFLYGTSSKSITYFIIINTFIKVLPLYYLRNQNLKWSDIYFTFGLFIIFILWLHLNQQSLVGNLKLVHDSLLYDKGATPFLAFIKKFETNFKHYTNATFQI
jgi:hypothetical protein